MASISDITGADINGSDSDPLIQRLVVTRLATPGVLDRRQLYGTYDRLSQPPTRHVPHSAARGIEPPPPSAPGLLPVPTAQASEHGLTWVRQAVSVASPPSISGAGVGGAGTGGTRTVSVGVSGAGIGSADTNGASLIGAGTSNHVPSPTARIAPPLLTATASTAQSAAAATAPLTTPTVARAAPSRALARAATSTGAAFTSNTNALAASPSITPATSGHQSVMRKADPAPPAARTSSSQPALPLAKQRPNTTTTRDPTSAEPLVRVPESRPSDIPSASPLAGLHSPAPRTASVSRTPARLVFRKPEAPTAPAPAAPPKPAKQHPTITTAAPNVIARTATSRWDPKRAGHSEAYEEAPDLIDEPRLEQIIERVERHLARQLEIESDRQGVRQWR